MGFNYADWKGPFYPADLPTRSQLNYYSRYFNAVEIDSTFYGTPRLTSVQAWAAATPPEFRFALKAPKLVTHELALEGAEAVMASFVETAQALGERLGVILFQFAPSFRAEAQATLARFLATLPAGPRYAVEFRHLSWHEPRRGVAALLREHGVAWAATQMPRLPDTVQVTAPFIYVRWVGKHGSFPHHTEERIDRGEELRGWQARLAAALAAQPVEAVYGFFNNDYAGFAPATARRFMAQLGLDDETPAPPVQGRLF
jgi:uncharacterized protein YecE (DUF72 family)